MNKYKALKLFKLWMILGALWVCATIYLSLTPNPPDSGVQYGDKIFHTLGYFCLFYWFAQIYESASYWRPAVYLILQGIVLEVLQYFTGYRSFEFFDMLANTSGVLIAWLVAHFVFAGWFVQFEKHILRLN